MKKNKYLIFILSNLIISNSSAQVISINNSNENLNSNNNNQVYDSNNIKNNINEENRFHMNQNGKNMSADDFDQWLKRKGFIVVDKNKINNNENNQPTFQVYHTTIDKSPNADGYKQYLLNNNK